MAAYHPDRTVDVRRIRDGAEHGVPADSCVDGIYARLAHGFSRLDVTELAGMFADDALYVTPTGRPLQGPQAILGWFERLFANADRRQARLNLRFDIRRREMEHEVFRDIGSFSLRVAIDGGLLPERSGRFVAVFCREADWTCRVDTVSNASLFDPLTPLRWAN